jgi:hypothetical protein
VNKDDLVNSGDRKNSNNGSRLGGVRPWRAARVVAALAVTALLAAACGGGGSGSGSSSDKNTVAPVAQVAAYASCMHSHGDPSFDVTRQTGVPSPSSLSSLPSGDIGTRVGGYITYFDPSSPGYQAAKKACQHLSPPPDYPTLPSSAHQQFLKEVRSATCMRSHGYPNWPDGHGQGQGFSIPAGVDTSSPQFQAAAKTCDLSVPSGG